MLNHNPVCITNLKIATGFLTVFPQKIRRTRKENSIQNDQIEVGVKENLEKILVRRMLSKSHLEEYKRLCSWMDEGVSEGPSCQ